MRSVDDGGHPGDSREGRGEEAAKVLWSMGEWEKREEKKRSVEDFVADITRRELVLGTVKGVL